MKLTKEQFDTLSQWEEHYDTAINAKYSRYPGAVALQTMRSTMALATGYAKNVNMACGTCVLHFLQDVGKVYFADKAERSRVAVKASDAKTVRTEVKTTKKAKK